MEKERYSIQIMEAIGFGWLIDSAEEALELAHYFEDVLHYKMYIRYPNGEIMYTTVWEDGY